MIPTHTPVSHEYENFLAHILANGREKKDRTGVGTRSIFGYQMRFDLSKGFPLVTTKKVHLRSIIVELLWFLAGDTNNNTLKAQNVSIWDEWAKPNGELGPVYGHQWRKWPGKPKMYRSDVVDPRNYEVAGYHTDADNKGIVMVIPQIDQIQQTIDLLRSDPDSRRIIVSAWNPADLPDMALSPCHALFQFYSEEMTDAERKAALDAEVFRLVVLKGMTHHDAHKCIASVGLPTRRLSCRLDQRSADAALGVPFNIASYALLTHMMAQQTNHAVGDLIWHGGDCHIYSNHVEGVKLQLTRLPYAMPVMLVDKAESIDSYTPDSFKLVGYSHHPKIEYAVAV